MINDRIQTHKADWHLIIVDVIAVISSYFSSGWYSNIEACWLDSYLVWSHNVKVVVQGSAN